MKGSYRPSLGNMCDLLVSEFSFGRKMWCLHPLHQAQMSPGNGRAAPWVCSPLSNPYGREKGLAYPVGSEALQQRFAWWSSVWT